MSKSKSKDYLQLIETLRFIASEFRQSREVSLSLAHSIEATPYPDSEYVAKLKGEAQAYEHAAIKIDALVDTVRERQIHEISDELQATLKEALYCDSKVHKFEE